MDTIVIGGCPFSKQVWRDQAGAVCVRLVARTQLIIQYRKAILEEIGRKATPLPAGAYLDRLIPVEIPQTQVAGSGPEWLRVETNRDAVTIELSGLSDFTYARFFG